MDTIYSLDEWRQLPSTRVMARKMEKAVEGHKQLALLELERCNYEAAHRALGAYRALEQTIGEFDGKSKTA